MAAETKIEWCDSTFNPWWGCSRIGPGCDNCYAAALDKRTGGDHWGKKASYKVMSENNWKNPIKWQSQAKQFFDQYGRQRRVFCASMSDVFDNRGPESERVRLWNTIEITPDLNWLLLTKRPRNIERYLPESKSFSNVWLGTTVENRADGIPRMEALKTVSTTIRFLSVEPLLEDLGALDLTGIHWVIVGGESGPKARPMKKEWMLNIRNQCIEQNVAFFFKQWGAIIGKGGCEVDGHIYKNWPVMA